MEIHFRRETAMLPCKVSFSLLHGYTILLSNFGLLYTFVIFGLPPVISGLFSEKDHTKFQFTTLLLIVGKLTEFRFTINLQSK